jgi:hypothetical protein
VAVDGGVCLSEVGGGKKIELRIVSNFPIKCLNSNNQYFQYLITKISKLRNYLD